MSATPELPNLVDDDDMQLLLDIDLPITIERDDYIGGIDDYIISHKDIRKLYSETNSKKIYSALWLALSAVTFYGMYRSYTQIPAHMRHNNGGIRILQTVIAFSSIAPAILTAISGTSLFRAFKLDSKMNSLSENTHTYKKERYKKVFSKTLSTLKIKPGYTFEDILILDSVDGGKKLIRNVKKDLVLICNDLEDLEPVEPAEIIEED